MIVTTSCIDCYVSHARILALGGGYSLLSCFSAIRVSTDNYPFQKSSKVQKMKLFLLPLLSLISLSAAASCPGCPADAPVNQKIVDFALQELEGGDGGLCKKTVISVDNFQQQVWLLFNDMFPTRHVPRLLLAMCTSLTWC